MTTYTFRYIGFAAQQQEAISAILDLADSALTCQWQAVDGQDSDVVMVNLDGDEGCQYYEAGQNGRDIYRIIAVSEEQSKANPQCWFLYKKPLAPPSLKELTVLLNEVAVVLAEANLALEASTEIAEQPLPLPLSAPVDNSDAIIEINDSGLLEQNIQSADESAEQQLTLMRPLTEKHYFFGLLMQAKQDRGCRIFKLNTVAELYVSPTENTYYFAGSDADLLRYCTLPTQYLTETQVTKARLNKSVINLKLIAQPLDNLLVFAVLKAAAGRLLEGHQPDREVILKQMPDTNKLSLLADYQRIAERLHKHPDTLFNLAENLQVPAAQVFDFYNVCSVMGYIDAVVSAKSAAEQKSGVLTHFLKSFFGK